MTKKIWSKSIRNALAVTLSVSMIVPSNIAYASETSGKGYERQTGTGQIELTDADIENLYQKVNFQRQSVHDPSITVSKDGTCYVFGSHMGVAKTTDLQNWSSTAISNQDESNAYYGVRKTKIADMPAEGLIKSFNFSDDSGDFAMQGTAAIVTNPDDENDKVLRIETGAGGKNGNYAITQTGYFSDVDFSNGVTISMNVRPTANSSDWNYLFSIGTTSSPVTGGYLYVDGTIGFIQRAGDPYTAYFPRDGWVEGNTVNSNYAYFMEAANSNKWYKLTYVYSASELSIYVDGTLAVKYTPDASLAAILANLNNRTELVLGAGADRAVLENFGGYIDDVFIYNTALTASEVGAIPAKAVSKTSNEEVIPVSYNDAFQSGAYGIRKIQTIDGSTVTVDFSKFPAGDWNTAITTNPDQNGNTSSWGIAGNMWAPDIIYNPVMKKWCMYLSLNGNVWNSVIVLLTADTIEGPYVYEAPIIYSGFTSSGVTDYKKTDLGLVLNNGRTLSSLPDRYNNLITGVDANGTATSSNHGSYGTYWPHAIDPCVFYDDDNNLWMGYGSWSGGIYIIQLDEETGLRDYTVKYNYEANGTPLNEGTKNANVTSDPYFGKKIAGGYYVSGEGSYIEKIGDYYYLFMSYGFYSPTGGYNMRIFRSSSPDGPYVDLNNANAIYTSGSDNFRRTSKGLQLMGNYQWNTMSVAEIAQGHNSAFVDTDGNAYVVYHTKFSDGTAGHQLRVHQLYQNQDGWIVAAPYEYAGETVNDEDIKNTEIPAADLTGDWELIVHQYNNTNAIDDGTITDNVIIATPKDITLNPDGSITGAYTGTWSEKAGTAYATIIIDGTEYKGVFTEQTIDGTNMKTMCFSAVNSSGVCIWGSKALSDNLIVAYNAKNEENKLPAKTKGNLTLSTNAEFGAEVTWSSSNQNIISNSGIVTLPSKDTEITLTKTIRKGKYFYQRTYKVTVYGSKSQNEGIMLYEKAEAGNRLMAVKSISSNTGVSITFTETGIDSDWTPVFLTENGEYVFLSVLNYDTVNLFENSAKLSSEAIAAGYNAGSAWTIFADRGTHKVTISYNVNGSIEFYKDGVLMLTYDANTAIGSYTVADLSKAMALAVRQGQVLVQYGMTDISIGYALDYDGTGDSEYLYYEDFTNLAGMTGTNTGWNSLNVSESLSVKTDNNNNYYFNFAAGGDSGNRGAYTLFGKEAQLSGKYTIELDTALTAGVLTQRSISVLAILGTDAVDYRQNKDVSSGYILKLRNVPPDGEVANVIDKSKQDQWYINDSDIAVTIPVGTWVHIKAEVNTEKGTVTATITNRQTREIIYTGTCKINGSGTLVGLQLLRGRGTGTASIDNITVKNGIDTISVGSRNADGTPAEMPWNDFSNFFGLKAIEDFTINWKFTNYNPLSYNWQNYTIAVTRDLDRTTGTYMENKDWYLRSDYACNDTFEGSTVTFMSDWSWDNFVTMLNGAEIEASLSRKGNTMIFSAVINGSDGGTYHYTVTVDNAPLDDVMVYLGGENCYLEISEYSIINEHR
ncbi:MAG: family 43 glycosylhydrolase [Lachnospiraceae bacterium]